MTIRTQSDVLDSAHRAVIRQLRKQRKLSELQQQLRRMGYTRGRHWEDYEHWYRVDRKKLHAQHNVNVWFTEQLVRRVDGGVGSTR